MGNNVDVGIFCEHLYTQDRSYAAELFYWTCKEKYCRSPPIWYTDEWSDLPEGWTKRTKNGKLKYYHKSGRTHSIEKFGMYEIPPSISTSFTTTLEPRGWTSKSIHPQPSQ